MLVLKIILIISFLVVFMQDIKQRQVYWFLFPAIGVLSGWLFYKNTLPELFYSAVIINTIFVFLLVSIIYLYARTRLKTDFFKTIGLGDLLLFFALALSFSSIAFIVIFICSLIFSLILHVIASKDSAKTVPLAGYMSLFFSISYMFHWLGISNHVYNL